MFIDLISKNDIWGISFAKQQIYYSDDTNYKQMKKNYLINNIWKFILFQLVLKRKETSVSKQSMLCDSKKFKLIWTLTFCHRMKYELVELEVSTETCPISAWLFSFFFFFTLTLSSQKFHNNSTWKILVITIQLKKIRKLRALENFLECFFVH